MPGGLIETGLVVGTGGVRCFVTAGSVLRWVFVAAGVLAFSNTAILTNGLGSVASIVRVSAEVEEFVAISTLAGL